MDAEVVWKEEMAVERGESRTSRLCLSRSHLRASGPAASKGEAISEKNEVAKNWKK
jgi:hypothetical protein